MKNMTALKKARRQVSAVRDNILTRATSVTVPYKGRKYRVSWRLGAIIKRHARNGGLVIREIR